LGPLIVPVGVDLHQDPLNVPPHLGHASSGRLGQDLVLNRQRHKNRHILQAAGHQERLHRVQHPAALHDLNRAEANIHEGAAVIDGLAGPSPGDPQAGREQAGGIEPALLKPGHG